MLTYIYGSEVSMIVCIYMLQNRQLGGSSEQGKRRSSAGRRLLREEIAESRGTSATRSLSEEVAQQRSGSLINPFLHPSDNSFTDPFIDSLNHRL